MPVNSRPQRGNTVNPRPQGFHTVNPRPQRGHTVNTRPQGFHTHCSQMVLPLVNRTSNTKSKINALYENETETKNQHEKNISAVRVILWDNLMDYEKESDFM